MLTGWLEYMITPHACSRVVHPGANMHVYTVYDTHTNADFHDKALHYHSDALSGSCTSVEIHNLSRHGQNQIPCKCCHLCQMKQCTFGNASASSALGYLVIPVQPVMSRVCSEPLMWIFSASMPTSVTPLMPCNDSSSRSGQPSASASTAASVSWTHHVRLMCCSGHPFATDAMASSARTSSAKFAGTARNPTCIPCTRNAEAHTLLSC